MPNDPFYGSGKLREKISEFTSKTGIKVDLIEMPWGRAWNNIVNSMKAGGGADVFQVGSSWVAMLAEVGYIADLGHIYEKLAGNIFDEICYKRDGKVFSLPWIIDVNLMFFNKQNCPAGFSVKNVDDLLKLPSGSFAFGGKRESIIIQFVSDFFWAYGGDYSKNLTDPGNLEALQRFFNFLEHQADPEFLIKKYGDVAWDFFLKGKGTYTVAGAWVIPTFIERHGRQSLYQAFPPPPGVSDRCCFLGGSCLVVRKNRKLEESTKLVEFLMSYDFQADYFSAIRALAGRKDAFEEIVERLPYKDSIKQALQRAKTYPFVPYWASFERAFTELLQNMMKLIFLKKYTRRKLIKSATHVDNLMSKVVELWRR